MSANEHEHLTEKHSNLLPPIWVVDDYVPDNVLDSLVSEFEVLLEWHSVLDLYKDNWECKN